MFIDSKFIGNIDELETVNERILHCPFCNSKKNGMIVPGEGSLKAKVAFVGEAPGKEEAKVGRPFIGRAGKLLRSLIKDVGLTDEEIYITSPVKYLPKNITPTLEEITHGKKHLLEQLKIIDPKFIVLLGRVAALAVLNKNIAVSKLHGTVENIGKKRYFISYHPAAALHNPSLRKEILNDFKKLKLILSVK